MSRWAWAEVDLGAIEHNVRAIAATVAPSEVWAVVKADGYGHGATAAAAAALRGGATRLCVALVQEGVELRRHGIDVPILVLSEQPPDELADAVRHGLTCTAYSLAQLQALAAAARSVARAEAVAVHLKIDTGMRRVGAAPAEAVALADAVAAAAPHLRLDGVFTHLAVADAPTDPFTDAQLDAFDAVLDDLARAGHDVRDRAHAANSAGALAHPRARYAAVRAGIASYGISPGQGVDHLARELRPAMSLHARVSHVKPVRAGEGVSYGLRHRFTADTVVATLPIGYADGVPRRSSAQGASVLLQGRRCPIVGVVTMDQLMVVVGHLADEVRVGDPAVLLGRQGEASITANEWGDLLGTIGYEVVCGISSRVARRHL